MLPIDIHTHRIYSNDWPITWRAFKLETYTVRNRRQRFASTECVWTELHSAAVSSLLVSGPVTGRKIEVQLQESNRTICIEKSKPKESSRVSSRVWNRALWMKLLQGSRAVAGRQSGDGPLLFVCSVQYSTVGVGHRSALTVGRCAHRCGHSPVTYELLCSAPIRRAPIARSF